MDWIAQNGNKFRQNDLGERYGDFNSTTVFINKSVFDRALEDAGFSSKALLSWMDKQGILVDKAPGRMTVLKRTGDFVVRCVALRLPEMEGNPFDI